MAPETSARAVRALGAQAAWSLVRRAEALRARFTGGAETGPALGRGPVFRVPPGPAGGRDPDPPLALTVDDGPDPRWTPALLDVLDSHGVRATFFVVGTRARAHPALLRRVLAAGHRLGNHSLTHRQPFAALTAGALDHEIAETQRVVADETGVTPVLFRAPAGGWSRSVLAAVRHHGLTPVDWTVDPKDWRRPPAGRIAQRVARARAGDIVLCHDGGGDRSHTVTALDTALASLRARGTRFAPL
ncbi:polysaccharide deacetylase family protein [Streptomyces sp. NPDC006743]|uniref:polysaccharide deacetylase family protein n=1 Tax=Streptomyces sp. NPDC006743 TaxID=3154480 RepID=UPI003453DBC1